MFCKKLSPLRGFNKLLFFFYQTAALTELKAQNQPSYQSSPFPFPWGRIGGAVTSQTSHHPYLSSSGLPTEILFSSENNPSHPHLISLLN